VTYGAGLLDPADLGASPGHGSHPQASPHRSSSFCASPVLDMPLHAQMMLHMHAASPLFGMTHSGLPQLKAEAARTARTRSVLLTPPFYIDPAADAAFSERQAPRAGRAWQAARRGPSSATMRLYQDSGNFSPNAKRVRVLAHEVGAALEIVPLDYLRGEWQKPEYLAKNPNGKVPTLEDDGFIIWESPAILFYLASKYGERGLVPGDTRGATDMMRWLFWNASHLEESVNAVAFETVLKPMMRQSPDGARVESATEDWHRFAPILDAQLEGKEWILGAFSIVDIAVGTTVEFGTVAGLPVNTYAHLSAWLTRLTARDAWKRASTR